MYTTVVKSQAREFKYSKKKPRVPISIIYL